MPAALLALALAAPAGAWDDADLCAPLERVVEQAPEAFEDLRGPATEIEGLVRDFSFQSTVLLPGARSCTIGLYGGVGLDRSMTCDYGTRGERRSQRLADRLAGAVRACVPDDWTVSEGRDDQARSEWVEAKAPGGMDATSVQVVRRRASTRKYAVEIRIQSW